MTNKCDDYGIGHSKKCGPCLDIGGGTFRVPTAIIQHKMGDMFGHRRTDAH